MRFSIITPSFRGGKWLRLCIASVADQGVDLEHIVQDSLSDDGTLDWLLADRRVKAYTEKDAGMYDAINRGLKKSSGDILAYLNCDEEYLPGALSAVAAYFERHPQVDVLFADCIVVDGQGQFVCYRKVPMPSKWHVMVSHLPTFTCSTFFRRRALEDHSLFFDSKWRDLGDADWVLRAMAAGVRMGILRRFVSTFADTGANMNLSANALREKRVMAEAAPAWARRLAPFLVLQHRLGRFLSGNYRQEPFDFAIYTSANPDRRVVQHVQRPTFVWKGRLESPLSMLRSPL
jgi:glycosyltransferase involved in cell wall biosynthesis